MTVVRWTMSPIRVREQQYRLSSMPTDTAIMNTR